MTATCAGGRVLEQRREPGDHEHAGGDHGRGVDEGRDGGRALHGVRQPGVEQELRRLAHGAHEEEQAGERERVPLEAEEGEGPVGRADLGGARKDLVEGDGAEQDEDQEDAEREAEIADPVDDEGLDRGGVGGGLLVPEADEEVAGEADALPAEEHLDEVVGRHQHQHGEGEQRQVGEEAGPVRILVHVADRVEVHEEGHGVDDDEHHRRQRVDAEGPVDDEVAGGHPLRDLDARRAGAEADLDEGDPGQDRAEAQEGGGDDLARTRADQAAEDAGDQEADQGEEDDGVVHGRRVLSPSSC